MIKALFFDLDGTLLDSKKKIPPSARDAILAWRQRGTKVFFASARSPRLDQTLGWTGREFDLFDGGIYSNGASVDFMGKWHFSYIHPDAVRACVEAAKAHEVHLSLHMPGEGYAFNFPVEACMHASWGLENARILPIDEESMNNTVKVLVFTRHLTDSVDALPDALLGRIREQCAALARVYVTDAGRTVQLSSLEAGKTNAIERIRKALSLQKDEVLVFGDDVNDLEMLSFYPHSVAMGNGCDEAKKAARYVTLANDADGIAHALNMLIG